MGWTKGRPRPRKVETIPTLQITETAPEPFEDQARQPVPPDWRKGALLNVRNMGAAYIVTLYPEEFNLERPHRALQFTNLGLCQDFVSDWYSRQSADPRAR